ncbi:hypothetical protein Tco_1392358 [Tanacetum coccineum]
MIPLSRVNTLGSGEDSMKLNELMEMCTKLFDRVLDLKNVKDAQDLEITNLKKRGKKLEKKKKSRTPQLKRRLFKVMIESFADKSLGDQEDASKHRRNEIDQDKEISWFQEDAETQGSAPITTAGVSVSTTEPSTPPTTTTLIEDEDSTIAQTLIKMRNYELTARLQAEEQGELTIEERSRLFVELIDKRKKHFARLRAEEQRRKPPTKTQKRNQICTYLKNMTGFTHNQLKNKSFDEVQKAFDKTMSWIDSFVPMDTESSEKKADSSKKRTSILLDDRKVSKNRRRERMLRRQSLKLITRADGNTKFYKIFSAMLDDFDRQDVLDLYRLAKERFETTSPEGYDRLLWGDLITLFEPSNFDVIVGMDWLAYHRAVIDCYEKIICIPLPNGEILKVHGEEPEKDQRSLSCIKADEKKLDDIRIVRDFPEVFLDDLSGLPQVREIEFCIDLIPGALPVVRSLYRLDLSKMLELSNQLKELQEKGFIRQSHSPWGALILLSEE